MSLTRSLGPSSPEDKKWGFRRLFKNLSPRTTKSSSSSEPDFPPDLVPKAVKETESNQIQEKLYIQKFEDFPPEIRSELRASTILREKMDQNLPILVNIVNFCFSKFRMVYGPPPKVPEQPSRPISKSSSANSLSEVQKDNTKIQSGGTLRRNTAKKEAIPSFQPDPTDQTAPPPKQTLEKPHPQILIESPESEKKTDNPAQTELISFEVEIDQAGEKNLMTHEDPKNAYKKGKLIAKGGFGQVYDGFDKHKTKIAIKVSAHTEREKKFNIREIGCLATFRHPNIVDFIVAYLHKNECWIVMEYMEGGTLTEAAQLFSLSESQISYVAKEILIALDFLHSKSWMHLDLKSGNIMMTVSGHIKLIDFGLCAHSSFGFKKTMAGSPFWMPPEMILRQPYSLPVDIWSFAICLLEMANRRPPTRQNKIKAMFTVATEGCATPLMEPDKWSSQFQNFLSQALVFDPTKRATAGQLLSHEFIQKAEGVETMAQVLSGVFIQPQKLTKTDE